MDKEIKTIPLLVVHSGIPHDTPHSDIVNVTENDDALKVMTDFTETVPLTIKHDATVVQTLERMAEYGVRLLLVKGIQGYIVGVITAYDIQSEKPVKYAAEYGVHVNDIQADMLMTKVEQSLAFDFKVVSDSIVAQVVATMKNLGKPHILVVEENNGQQRIRGIFSSSNISRLLGRPAYQPLHAAYSFADLQNKIGDHLTQ
jgi:CBS domain-containing protein